MNKAPNFDLKMINGINFNLYQTLQNSAVMLNFIMGTWCPTCTMHMGRVRRWQESNGINKLVVLTISSESEKNIRKWVEDNNSTLLFASDAAMKISKIFKVKVPLVKMARPATLLIDTDQTIKLRYTGMRTNGWGQKVSDACESCKIS